MSFVVSVEDTGVCRKQVTVEVPPDEVEAATRRVVQQYAQSARIPGFRRGKVPSELVRRRYREEIEREVVERLVPDFWERAREEQGIDPLGQPQLREVGELAEGAPLRFVTVVEVRPSVALDELEFELPELEVEPTGEEIEAALEDLRRQAGEWVPVERPAARGDLVALRVHRLDEGADEEGQAAEVEVGDPRVWEELSLAVTGLAAGQESRFSRRPEEGAEGEPGHFRAVVESVREREPAALDDELARKVAGLDGVDALRGAVTDRLRQGKLHERDQKRREALLEQLRQRYPLALPQGAVDGEVESMAQEFAHDLSHRGIDPEQAGVDWQRLAGELRGPAERRVHQRLLLDAAADKLGIEAPAEEVAATLSAIARARKTTVERVRESMGGTRALAARLRRDRVVRRLLGEDETTDHNHQGTAGGAAAAEPGEG